MKLESLKLEKFKNESLKRDHMAFINGGLVGTLTLAGSGCGVNVLGSNPTAVYSFDYGYDSIRTREDGSTYATYHNRTNVTIIDPANCIGL